MAGLHNFLTVTTGGHFAYACVHPLKDNSVGTSKTRIKAISLVL